MSVTTDTCWADPLTRAERRVLREKLARACKSSWDAADMRRMAFTADAEVRSRAFALISAEMSNLHLDVTERAKAPAR